MSEYVDLYDYPLHITKTKDIDPQDKELYVPVADLRCEFCEVNKVHSTPKHYYDDLYLCTLHFEELRAKYNALAQRLKIHFNHVRRQY